MWKTDSAHDLPFAHPDFLGVHKIGGSCGFCSPFQNFPHNTPHFGTSVSIPIHPPFPHEENPQRQNFAFLSSLILCFIGENANTGRFSNIFPPNFRWFPTVFFICRDSKITVRKRLSRFPHFPRPILLLRLVMFVILGYVCYLDRAGAHTPQVKGEPVISVFSRPRTYTTFTLHIFLLFPNLI